MRLFLLFLLTALTTPVPAQTIHYVDAAARGAGDGTGWANAFTEVQAALAAAAPGDEIWVAGGTYTPTRGTDRTATFQLRSGVRLYGGFAGTETHRAERDPAAHATRLSGDIGRPGDATDNVYHVVTGSGTDTTAVLDGFVVTGGRADGPHPDNYGAGLYNRAGSPTIARCVFVDNHAFRSTDERDGFGGGMANDEGSHPRLTDVRFERNTSAGGGGGMANRHQSHPRLTDVVFAQNEAGILGGGMTNDGGSSPMLVRVRFERNRARYTGGLDSYQQAQPQLYSVTFLGNVATEYGGGMTADEGSDALLVNVVFAANRADNATETGAAGLQVNGSSPTLIGVTFAGNRAPRGAGAIGHRGPGHVTVRNAILWDNGTELVDETGEALDVAHALVQGGFAAGSAILDADPQFTEPLHVGDLRLRPSSPARNAGTARALPTDAADLDGDGRTDEPLPHDLAGHARVQDGAPDLGAYETPGHVPSGTPSGDR